MAVRFKRDEVYAMAGEVSPQAYKTLVSAKEALVEELEVKERRLSTPTELYEALQAAGMVEAKPEEFNPHARWHSLELSTQRRLARALFSTGVLGEFRITQAPARGMRVPVMTRVVTDRGGKRKRTPLAVGQGAS